MVNLALARNRLRDRPARRSTEDASSSAGASPLARLSVVNNKAAPSLALSAPDVPTNCIPFPSAPISCAGRAADTQDDVAMDVDDAGAAPVRNVRKRAKSGTPGETSDEDDLPAGARRVPKRSMLRKPEGRAMASALPLPKRARKIRKPGPEARFMALVHRSLAWHMRSAGPALVGDACAAQDALLAKRLWRRLLDHGMQPTPMAADDDAAMDTNDGPSPALASPPPPGPANMLSMPQLVALLTLRHRDRPANRPRQTPKDEQSRPAAPRQSSPLARVCVVAP